MMKKILLPLLSLMALGMGNYREAPKRPVDPPFLSAPKKWVDSVFNSLTPDQRLGQLFMIAAYSNRDLKHVQETRELIEKYNIGGLIWMQGGPIREGKLANYFQTVARTPLLYSMDAEWGLAMRLDSTPRYPRQMTLGAIQDDSLIYQMGRQVAKDCKRLGIHINFAPVADINNNPANPVIGMRSFGENKFKVAKKAYMYMQGMQDENVMANGKHFPGHGDTDSDSHTSLPVIQHSAARLDSLELYPFKYLFGNGLSSVMVAHLNIPALDTTKNIASTLSPFVVDKLLKKDLGFKGLIFTDALNMKGAAGFIPGVVDVKALLAGNDVLLFSGDVPKAVEEIKLAITAGTLKQEDLDQRIKKILKAKYWCGLNHKQEIVTRNITAEINSPSSEKINEKLAEAAITLLKNEKNFLPLKGADTTRMLEVSVGIEEENSLYFTLRNYGYTEHVGLSHTPSETDLKNLYSRLSSAQIVVLQLNKTGLKPENNFGLNPTVFRLLDTIASIKPTVLVMVNNPYLLNVIPSLKNYRAVLMTYEYMPSLLRAAANAIAGTIKVTGKLPVSTSLFKADHGLTLEPLSEPKSKLEEKFADRRFRQVDSLAMSGILEKAYPGCEIVAMKDGKVVYQKSFGTYTYGRDSKLVDNGTMYDLASVSKIAATSLALMKLRSEGKFDYTKKLVDYLPELAGTDKADLLIEDVLSHQAGLQAWIPFYQATMEKDRSYKQGYYSSKRSEQFPVQVAKDLFAVKGIQDTVYAALIKSKIQNPGKYLYSDLGYYFMQRIIERITGQPLDLYVRDLYAKVGVGLTYKPLNYFSKLQIAPTENDEKYRKQIVQGYVHDPGAALMGGVAAHAGVFGNATELAKIMQLFLNKGELNKVRLLDSNVVKEFTTCRFCPGNRRGLCFEKPEPDEKKESPVVADCSLESFGHSGFTGTFAWADPKYQLVVVFLSNRVYPDADDNKLTKLGIRGKVHKAFYDALK